MCAKKNPDKLRAARLATGGREPGAGEKNVIKKVN